MLPWFVPRHASTPWLRGCNAKRPLHPHPLAPPWQVEHPEDEPHRLWLGFAGERSAAEWYALLALCTRDGGDGVEEGAAALGQARAVAAS